MSFNIQLKMDFTEFKKHLKKYKDQDCSETELKKLYETFSDTNNEKHIKDLLLEDLSKFQHDKSECSAVNFDKMFSSVNSSITQHNEERKMRGRIVDWKNHSVMQVVKIAAVLLIVFALGGGSSYFLFNHQEKTSFPDG